MEGLGYHHHQLDTMLSRLRMSRNLLPIHFTWPRLSVVSSDSDYYKSVEQLICSSWDFTLNAAHHLNHCTD